MGVLNSQYSDQNVLHTYSLYNATVDFSEPSISKQNDIVSQLEAKEQLAYHKMWTNCTNFPTFINNIRSLLNDPNYQNDKIALQFFQNENLLPKITAMRDRYLNEQAKANQMGWHFTLDVSKKDLNSKAKALYDQLKTTRTEKTGADWTIQVNQDGLYEVITSGFDILAMKEAINTAIGTHYKVSSSGGTRTGSLSTKALSELINNWSNTPNNTRVNQAVFRFIESPNTPATLNIDYEDPLTYNAALLHSAEVNKQDRILVDEGLKWIYTQVKDQINWNMCSREFQTAFARTWTENIMGGLSKRALFMKGGGDTAIAGGFGEFQTALINNYILTRYENHQKVSPKLCAVISNTLSQEQSRRDVTILEDVGVQVKNYNPLNKMDLKTHTYLTTMRPYFVNDPNISSIFRFLANYYFNRSYAISESSQKRNLEQNILPRYFAQIANFDLNNEFIKDTVSFYFIEGRYLVPTSHIVKAVYSNKINIPVKITSSYRDAHSDIEFAYNSGNKGAASTNELSASKYFNSKRGEKYTKPLLYDYWNKDTGTWVPTEQNKNYFEHLLSTITLHSQFSRIDFTTSQYDIFLPPAI